MKKPTILLVEDHEPLRVAIKQVLQTANYTVLPATDGMEALEMMERTRPDLIVADIMMPRMDGYVFYDAVRARQEWVPIPFIFLTAKAEKGDILKGKQLGAEDYIIKPFDPQELLVTVEARLGRAKAIQEATTEEFDQLKRQIINMLSHELRTPLTYIQGYTSLALDDIPSLSPDALEEFLTAIKQGADRLTQLVEDILVLVRLDTGQAEKEFQMLARTHTNLAEMATRTIQQHSGRAATLDVTLESKIASDLPPVQLCEPFFVDALSRLVDNAVKFSHGKGKKVTVSSHVVAGWVEIAVQDEGIGITEEELPHLFERFRQIDREHMEQQGSGLGLSIARELIALHDGEITVESESGKGSTFTIRLPIAE
jgi:two-component system sensor histidine kinase/response regulator